MCHPWHIMLDTLCCPRIQEKPKKDLMEMKSETAASEALTEIIDREVERHPHNRNLLEAYRSVLVERRRVLEGLSLSMDETFHVDKMRFGGGVPISGQYGLFREDDPWEDLARAMIAAIVKGFPHLENDLKCFDGVLSEKKLDLYEYFRGDEKGREQTRRSWNEAFGLSTTVVAFVLQQVARIVLEKRCSVLAEQLEGQVWDKGYCPICGSFPTLSIIGEKIGERRLYCSDCGHDWLFSRVICPCCGHEGQEGMNFFLIEDKAQEAAFTCDQCRRYLITLHRVSDLNDRDLDVSAMGLVHLDVIMQEKGFVPMADTGWNVLGIESKG